MAVGLEETWPVSEVSGDFNNIHIRAHGTMTQN